MKQMSLETQYADAAQTFMELSNEMRLVSSTLSTFGANLAASGPPAENGANLVPMLIKWLSVLASLLLKLSMS